MLSSSASERHASPAQASLAEAVEWHRQGRLREACVVYHAMLGQPSEAPEALQWLATAQVQRGSYQHALVLYDQSIALSPDYAEAHANRGNALRCLQRLEEAVASFDRAIAMKPDYAEAWCNRGIALRDLTRLEEAVASHDRALDLRPDYTNALKSRGVALSDLGRFHEALACHERVLELQPQDTAAWIFRGNCLHRLLRLQEAVASYDRALELNPRSAEAWHNRSIPLRELKRISDAIESCDHAIALNPDHADAHWHKAELLILSGDYLQGWPLFEWRWRSLYYSQADRHFDQRIWLGKEDISGKTVLINPDGGFGDTLHFCRYAPLLAQRGARVILEVQPALVSLLQESFPALEVIANGQKLPSFDYYCPMMTLPVAMVTPVEEVPARIPYLHTPPDHRHRWATRLGQRTRPRIGLVWSGSTDHSNDHHRSVAAALFEPLLAIDAEFHCLQKVIRSTDRESIAKWPIKTWEAELADFAETAALTAEMDLVISVDTSVAHLAGALGRPVCLLLPYVPDMRWLADGAGSHWYPSVMRLFRQDTSRQWPQVVMQLLDELPESFAEPGHLPK